jgi:hypothetical protein
VRVTLYGKNLTDERGFNHVNTLNRILAPDVVSAGTIQPRTVGIDLAYRF